jgi:predicted nucleotidyltransferase
VILETLRALAESGARFVVIGGIAARVHGSARITEDIDICYDTTPEPLHALAALLNTWNPRLRIRGGRGPVFPLDERALRELAAITLETERGAIDLLREVKGIGDYAACRAESEAIGIEGVQFDVLTLPALMRAKRASGRRKDHEALLELEALAELADRRSTRLLSADVIEARLPSLVSTDLDEIFGLFARIRRLQFDLVRHAQDPGRTYQIQTELAALPPLEEVARRIVAATRGAERQVRLTPEQLTTLREARAVLGAR